MDTHEPPVYPGTDYSTTIYFWEWTAYGGGFQPMIRLTDRQERIREIYLAAAFEYPHAPDDAEPPGELHFRATTFAMALDRVLEDEYDL